ncbi:unnamed protein product [Paramecium pentaurelia]|uniref:Protein kinase domain-containing protein n=1 Tax=Paramecium pentaurelia TaxID=43138 RepID=A0A8S1TA87_9CILI|nr:unnamed protein product [Paramecium pentaurelia]
MINKDQCIEDYRIQMNSSIGRGNYGEVFDCKSTRNPQYSLCAKIINTQVLEKYKNIEKMISQLVSQNKQNQNLVTIYDVKHIAQEKKLIIIMEKCESNLQKLINIQKKFNDSEVFNFIDQFLNGYQVLYDNNIIHRDIKPENILIQQKTYKLSDFGTGKIYKANDFLITKIGTPVYTAPEINSLVQDHELDIRFQNIKFNQHSKSQVDIFSLGIILYQMVYGELPFEHNQTSIIEFAKRIKKNPLQLTGQSKHKNIIEQMLIYYPDERMTFQCLYNLVSEKKNTKISYPIQIKQKDNQIKSPQVSTTIPSLNQNGGNQNGSNQNIFNQNGFNQNGFKLNGLNQNGFNQNGFKLNGSNQNGFNQNGSYQNIFNQNGLNQNGLNQNGFNQNGSNQNGLNQNGFNQNGSNQNIFYQNGFNQNGVIKNEFNQNEANQNGLNQQFQLQNNCIPNIKIKSNQFQTPPQKEDLSLISPHQKIKEYLQFLLNDHGDIIKDDIKNLIQYLIQNSTFSIEQLKQLITIYKNQIQKPDLCENKTLIFFYCILCILNNTTLLNIQSFDDKKLREQIKRLYDNLNST